PLDENVDRAYAEENLMPSVAGILFSEEIDGGQSYSDDSSAIKGVTLAESPSSLSNYCGDAC
ncbi:MAG TPA: hypothetical protein VGC39_10370, partial [Candidatus Methylacidiphilales bacterium]